MEVRQNHFGRKEVFQAYISQINWDWLFLKGQLIFIGIIFLGLLAFLIWFLQ